MKSGAWTRRTFWSAVAALACAAAPYAALACGGFFVPDNEVDTEVVDTSDQRVLYAIDDGHVSQFVQVEYTSGASQLAWIYPVAGNATVAEGPDDLFALADELSRPRITITTPAEVFDGGGGGGCMGAASDRSWGEEDAGTNDQEIVEVWSSGQVGIFDYVVVSSESVDPLMDWLTGNGFAVPEEATPVISHYVGAGWFFVAMRISPEQVPTAQTSTTTIVFEYESEEPVFPLHMASLSSADGVSVTLYVLAERSYETSGMDTAPIDASRIEATSAETSNYDEVFLDAVGRDAQRRFVREAVVTGSELVSSALPSATGSFVLTRLRTRIDSQQMSADIRLLPSAVDVAPAAPHYTVVWNDGYAADAGTRREGLIAFASLGLVVFFTFRRLRRS
jgi:hypothetical protein